MINLFKPCLGDEELQNLKEVFESGWTGLGPKTEEFEKKFAEYIGSKYAVGLNSATSALDLSLKLLNIKQGDEVIVPTITFVSTAHAVIYNSANPIFADVDNDLLIDIEDVKNKITTRTKAIIPVHYSGRPVNIKYLKKITKNIPIVEDCAHACGASLNGKKCGNMGDIGIFSFHAVKNLCTGDGGMIVTNNYEIYKRALQLRWLGIDKGTWNRTNRKKQYNWEYDVPEIGLKCHMNDISASIGLAQLKKLDKMNNRRKQIAERYTIGLKCLDEIILPMKSITEVNLPSMDTDTSKSSWHIYCIKCLKRDELSIYLKEKGISTGVHYKPIHLYKCYGNTPYLPQAEKYFKDILSLPMYPDLTDDEVDIVIHEIKKFYKNFLL